MTDFDSFETGISENNDGTFTAIKSMKGARRWMQDRGYKMSNVEGGRWVKA